MKLLRALHIQLAAENGAGDIVNIAQLQEGLFGILHRHDAVKTLVDVGFHIIGRLGLLGAG